MQSQSTSKKNYPKLQWLRTNNPTKRETETALHGVVRTVERSFEHKQYTRASFWDTEEAFNNVSNEAISKTLEILRVSDPIIKNKKNLLRFGDSYSV